MKSNKLFMAFVAALSLIFCIYLLYYSGILYEEDIGNEKEVLVQKLHKDSTVEGKIVDREANIIVEHTADWTEDKAVVPIPYSYLIGYNSPIYGTSGIRARYEDVLYDDSKTSIGGTITLTILDRLQKRAYYALKDNGLSGSITVLNTKTGEILAMVSRKKVDYDVNCLNEETYANYAEIDGFFLNSACYDQDPPGSTFKVLTAIASIENDMADYEYNDTGTYTIDGYTVHNFGNASYGLETLQSAFVHSTNTYFASLALKMGNKAMKDVTDRFLIGESIDMDFTTINSGIEYNGSDILLAQTSFGQGRLQISPLHLAMIGQAISNDGTMLQPYLIEKAENAKGKCTYGGKVRVLIESIDANTANQIKKIMNETTMEKYPNLLEYNEGICIKTGTAELGNGLNHAYILSFDDNYSVIISINDTYSAGGSYISVLEKIYCELYEAY